MVFKKIVGNGTLLGVQLPKPVHGKYSPPNRLSTEKVDSTPAKKISSCLMDVDLESAMFWLTGTGDQPYTGFARGCDP